jgi:23S rRNA pseudouridine1911/1915/1917 synthase
VIHRVDRPVSGVVFFAKTSKVAARMSEMIRNGEFHKTYHAVTYSKPEPVEGKLVNYLFRDEKRNKSYIVPEDKIGGRKDIQRAELNYRCLASSERYHLVEVELITGRHHQIRVQLSSMGCVIKGDLKYGAPRSNPDGSISLHARRVEFVHPVTKQPVCVVAPYPSADKIWSFFNNVND